MTYYEDIYGRLVPFVRRPNGTALTTTRDGRFIWARDLPWHMYTRIINPDLTPEEDRR